MKAVGIVAMIAGAVLIVVNLVVYPGRTTMAPQIIVGVVILVIGVLLYVRPAKPRP